MSKSMYIIPEEAYSDANEHAEKMLQEVNDIFNGEGWKKEGNSKGVLVESIKVEGDLKESKILMMRSKGEVKGSAQEVFDLLVSPKGYAILDPICDPEDHEKPLVESYHWRKNARLELATANVNFPMMPKADFLVLNAIDPNTRIFASKSVVHPKYPGSSIYYNGNEAFAKNLPNSKVRAINTMAIQVNPISDEKCELLVFNYIDMCVKKAQSPWLFNIINTRFFPGLYKRIEKHLDK